MRAIKLYDCVQIKTESLFGGCFVVVTKIRDDEISGYITVPTPNGLQQIPIAEKKVNVMLIGEAEWVAEEASGTTPFERID